jgi:hypothetical protein
MFGETFTLKTKAIGFLKLLQHEITSLIVACLWRKKIAILTMVTILKNVFHVNFTKGRQLIGYHKKRQLSANSLATVPHENKMDENTCLHQVSFHYLQETTLRCTMVCLLP